MKQYKEKGTTMFITIIEVNGYKSYFGPFATQKEARECQRTMKAEAKKQWKTEEVHSEVVKLEEF